MKKMTKFFILVIITLLISGCGNKNDTQTPTPTPNSSPTEVLQTKKCTEINETTNLKKEIELKATDEIITDVKVTITYDNKTLGIDDFSTFTDDQKEQYKDNMLNNLGLDEQHYEGLDITFNFDKQLSVVFTADIKKIDSTILDQVGLNIDLKNIKLEKAIDLLEKKGITCN